MAYDSEHDRLRELLRSLVVYGPNSDRLADEISRLDVNVARLAGATSSTPGDLRDTRDPRATSFLAAVDQAIARVSPSSTRRLLRFLLGPDTAGQSLQDRREEAGRRFRGDERAVTATAVRTHFEPKALELLTEALMQEPPVEQGWLGIVGPDGEPLEPGSPSLHEIVVDAHFASVELIKKLAARPDLLYTLTPRQFEEVVAELLQRRGYDVTLTPASRDGGVDIYAAKRDMLGTFLYIVECKRYSPENHVEVGLIRQLLGNVTAHKANAGVLATTSFFTNGAIELQRKMEWQLSLKNYADVSSWLDEHVGDINRDNESDGSSPPRAR